MAWELTSVAACHLQASYNTVKVTVQSLTVRETIHGIGTDRCGCLPYDLYTSVY